MIIIKHDMYSTDNTIVYIPRTDRKVIYYFHSLFNGKLLFYLFAGVYYMSTVF